ncbi:MAG: phospho-sugar mutase [Myxococcales bacterium]|nr:phospho-sugar mutase [Myxococcales bacterium]
MTDDELVAFAAAWMADDPDPETAAATAALLAGPDLEGLRACFGERLTFGTAGLRGALGPGPNRMNQAHVRRASAGFGHYLIEEATRGTVAVGYDGRHGSRVFAEDTARVLAGLGFTVFLADAPAPTPALAFAVRKLCCTGGVMVTASHNPPQDNGYKVYWGNGAQIVPPHDTGISACIGAIESLAGLSVPPLDELRRAQRVRPIPAEVDVAYAAEVDALRCYDGPTDLQIVYTAMHGVGRRAVEDVLKRNGYVHFHAVAAQAEPDPDFPTVAFPNPEEPGALDLALAEARARGADVVLANDPDADRLAVAVPDGAGGYRALTGNELGVLLADELLTYGARPEKPLVATTVVSSQLLGRMAAAAGVAFAETLTGFKWLATEALRHARTGGHFVMGYEEAIGYSVGEVVRDKDGVSAALIVCDLVARAKRDGVSVLDRLAALYRRHGLHRSTQKSLKMPPSAGAELMARLRADAPTTLGGVAVEATKDYLLDKTGLPPSDLLAFRLAGGHRVLVRPSGTEPKVKIYVEVVLPFGEGEPLAAGEARADALLATLVADAAARLG